MASIKKTRKLLGLTQQELANYLSLSRAQVSLAEIGRRNLPMNAQVKLAALERHMAGKASTRVSAEIQKQSAKARNVLFTQAQKHTACAKAAAGKLETMRGQYNDCLKILNGTSGLLAELGPGAATKKDRLWLEVLQEETLKKMEKCGMQAQVLLQLQADVFSFHARQAQVLMA